MSVLHIPIKRTDGVNKLYLEFLCGLVSLEILQRHLPRASITQQYMMKH